MMRLKKVVILIVVLIIQTSYTRQYIYKHWHQAKYRNFDNFDHVNSEAIKGGDIVISAFGTFDLPNPFLKSLSPAQITI